MIIIYNKKNPKILVAYNGEHVLSLFIGLQASWLGSKMWVRFRSLHSKTQAEAAMTPWSILFSTQKAEVQACW